MTDWAVRGRAHRARLKDGVIVVAVEIKEVDVEEALRECGRLTTPRTDDGRQHRKDMGRALESLVRDWAAATLDGVDPLSGVEGEQE